MPGAMENMLVAFLASMAGQQSAKRNKMMEELQRMGLDIRGKQADADMLRAKTGAETARQAGMPKPITEAGNVWMPYSGAQSQAETRDMLSTAPDAGADIMANPEPNAENPPSKAQMDFYDMVRQLAGNQTASRLGYKQVQKAPPKLESIGASGSMDEQGNLIEPFVPPKQATPLDPTTEALRVAQTDQARATAEKARRPTEEKGPNLAGMVRAGYMPELDPTGKPTGKFKAKPRTAPEIRAELEKWITLGQYKNDPTTAASIQAIISGLKADLDALGLQGGATADPWARVMQGLNEAFPDTGQVK